MITENNDTRQHGSGDLDSLRHKIELTQAALDGLVETALRNGTADFPGADFALDEIHSRIDGSDRKNLERQFKALFKSRSTQKKSAREEKPGESSASKRVLTGQELERAKNFGKQEVGGCDVYTAFNALMHKSGCFLPDPSFGHYLMNILASTLLESGTTFSIRGASSSGKTFAFETATKLLPSAADMGHDILIDMTGCSKTALSHLGNLSGRILYYGEKSDEEDEFLAQQRRQLQDNKSKRYIVEREHGTGPFKIRIAETVGPVVQVFCTTGDPQDEKHENRNREHVAYTNDSPKATFEKLKLSAHMDSHPWLRSDPSLLEDRETFQLFFLSLQRYPVFHWFAPLIRPKAKDTQELEPTDSRLYSHLKTYIACSALLNQHHRHITTLKDGRTYLMPDWSDYLHADKLLRATAPRPLEILPPKAEEAFERIRSKLSPTEFYTRGDITAILRKPAETVRKWLPKFVEAGLLKVSDETRGRSYLYRLGDGKHSFRQVLNLVDPDSIPPEVVSQLEFAALIEGASEEDVS